MGTCDDLTADQDEEIESNAVSVYIHQLRKKLGTDFIQNVRGVGYFVGGTPSGGSA